MPDNQSLPTIDEIMDQRGRSHGDYEAMASLTQKLEGEILDAAQAAFVNLDPMMRESIHMICLKLSRVATGNPAERDHWIDIEGYAKLISMRL